MTGKQLQEIRAQKIEISEDAFVPLFVYLGDTHINTLEKKKDIIFKYPIIIVECTFIRKDQDIEIRANRDGHIIWDDLKNYVLAYPNIIFILIHWSLRYTEQEVYDFFNDQLILYPNERLDNIRLFLGNVDEK
jgi:ribonuclease Z